MDRSADVSSSRYPIFEKANSIKNDNEVNNNLTNTENIIKQYKDKKIVCIEPIEDQPVVTANRPTESAPQQKTEVKTTPIPQATPPISSKRYALVIGNDNYSFSPKLSGQPLNDARDVAQRLKDMGFSVILATDASRQRSLDDLDEFVIKAQKADVLLFYYSGHGVQDGIENYLVPIDARFLTKSDIANRALSITGIINKLGNAQAKVNILAMDACRNTTVTLENASTKSDIPKGFKTINSDQLIESVYISLASRTGMPALIDGNGRNSYFTAAILKYLQNGQRIETIFRRVSAEVERTTSRQQQPEIIDRLKDDFSF